MSKKKTLLTILAVVLVCCIAVAGTLAVLTMASTKPVQNTFIAAGGGQLAAGLELKEHGVDKNTDGSYTLKDQVKANEVDGNKYEVLPGVDLPKDPFVRIDEKTDAPAYLYVEVVNGLDANMSFTMKSDWTLLTGVTGQNGGAVYVYKNGEILTKANAPAGEIYILDGNTITVGDNVTALSETGETGVALTFYGYMVQASAGTPAEALIAAGFGTAK